jgi:hypothetical protein
MNQINSSQFKSVSDLPRKYAEILKDANEFGYVYLLKNNKHVGGVVGMDYLEKLKKVMRKQILREIEEEEVYERIQRGREEYRQGKARKVNSVRDIL